MRAFDSRWQKAKTSLLILCLCADHFKKLAEISRLNSSLWTHVYFFTYEASGKQPAVISHPVWWKSPFVAVIWSSPVFFRHAVALLILAKLELEMVGRRGDWNRTRTAASCMHKNEYLTVEAAASQHPQTLVLNKEVQPPPTWSPPSHTECLLPDTIHLKGVVGMAHWCCTMMRKVLC